MRSPDARMTDLDEIRIIAPMQMPSRIYIPGSIFSPVLPERGEHTAQAANCRCPRRLIHCWTAQQTIDRR